MESLGVSDGTRTRDIQDHNLALYQLSYTHHRPSSEGCHEYSGLRPCRRPRYASAGLGFSYLAAISRAVAESGPGWGTNTASR
jgi:hypothetical protein